MDKVIPKSESKLCNFRDRPSVEEQESQGKLASMEVPRTD
jgi:hypothetical protein